MDEQLFNDLTDSIKEVGEMRRGERRASRVINKPQCSFCKDEGFNNPFPCIVCGKLKPRDMRQFIKDWRKIFSVDYDGLKSGGSLSWDY